MMQQNCMFDLRKKVVGLSHHLLGAIEVVCEISSIISICAAKFLNSVSNQ